MISRLPALLATLFLALMLTAPAFADDAMLVIDSSASMGGKLGRDRKADLVADAVRTAVSDFPTEARIGLLAFGSRSKTSCSDAEIIVRPQTNGNEHVAEAAAALKPRGKSPIAVALERAANALDYQKKRATIVVFVDKVEACDADPCVLAEALKKKAHDLTVEVIGLGLADEEIPGVACIAEKTGGKFLNAKDGTDLDGGLAAALASAKAPPPTLPTASIEAPASVMQSEVFDVGYDGPKAKGDRIQVAWPGLPPGSEIRGVLVGEDGKHRKLTAPTEAGTYELRYFHPALNAVLATRPIEVAMRPVSVTVPAHVAAGAPFSIGWTGPAAEFDEIRIASAAEPKVASAKVKRDGRPVVLDAPLEAGTYEAQYHQAAENSTGASVRFTVDAPVATLRAPSSAEAGSRITVEWTGPAARYDNIVIAQSDMRADQHVTSARIRPDRPSVSIAVPREAGSYELRYIAGDGRAIFASVPFTVE